MSQDSLLITSEADAEAAIGVLFVDDEKNILSSIKRLMIDESFSIFTAESGEEGLEILASEADIGLIVSDQRMPGMSGTVFLEKARAAAPDALRILLTGYADITATVDAINKGGAYRYITKPWVDGELLQTVREGVKTYRLTRENRRLTAIVQKQNEELKDWNAQLKSRVLQQTARIRKQNEDLFAQNSRLQRSYRDTIAAMSGLIELRSKQLRNHSRNVAALSVAVAAAMGLAREEVERIQVASLLHDIGKIGTPDSLSRKNVSELSQEEREEYLQHAVRGQMALDAVEELRPAGILIRHHHEHFDGSGYPDGCRGEEIPLGARIIAIADFVDRTIQTIYDVQAVCKTLGELEQSLGTLFDPQLFPHFDTSVRTIYRRDATDADLVEKIVTPDQLREGMILASDLFSGTGLLLLGRGERLTGKRIEAILRHQKLDPVTGSISVLVRD